MCLPAALDTAKQPFRSKTWAAAMNVICERDGGDLDRTRRLHRSWFEQAVRREILKRGGQKPSLRIAGKLFAALTDPTGVTAYRPVRWTDRVPVGRLAVRERQARRHRTPGVSVLGTNST